jgi:hypothetical protein
MFEMGFDLSASLENFVVDRGNWNTGDLRNLTSCVAMEEEEC